MTNVFKLLQYRILLLLHGGGQLQRLVHHEQHVWSVVAPLLHVAQAPRQAQQRVRAVCGRRRRREDEQVKIQSGPKLNLFHWNKFDRLGVEGGCAVGAAEYVRQS
jgi:hypothetical protein